MSIKKLIGIVAVLLTGGFAIATISSNKPTLPPQSPSVETGHDDHEEGEKQAQHGKGETQHQHDEEEEHSDHDEKIVLLKPNEITEFGIEIKTAGPGELNTYVNLPGEVRVNADRLAHIVPRVSGVVLEVRKNLGDHVKAGEIMAVLESAELGKAKTEYFHSKQQLDIAETDRQRAQTIHDNTRRLLDHLKAFPDPEMALKDTAGLDMGENRSRLISSYSHFLLTRETYNREKGLYEKKISSQAEFLIAESEYKSAQAVYLAAYDEVSFFIKRDLLEKNRAVKVASIAMQAAERNLRVLGLTDRELESFANENRSEAPVTRVEMRAPIAGTVIEKHITLGEMLQRDAKSFVVADLSAVWVDLNVYQKDLPLIREGLQAVISAGHGIPNAKGKISYLRPLVGEQTRTALARIVLPNPNKLWRPGLFISGKVAVGNVSVPLMILKSAVQNIDGQTVVFVETNEGFQSTPVTLGKTSEDFAEVLAGISPGQRYVARGGFTLKAELAKGGFASGHSH